MNRIVKTTDTVIKTVNLQDSENIIHIWDSHHSDFGADGETKLYHVVVDTPYRDTTHTLLSAKSILDKYEIDITTL